jgi:hypothetical protein
VALIAPNAPISSGQKINARGSTQAVKSGNVRAFMCVASKKEDCSTAINAQYIHVVALKSLQAPG